MDQAKLKEIGYRQHYYGYDSTSDTKQCFHCKYGQVVETNREQIICNRWNMVVWEDDICNSFEFATLWAFDYTDEDKVRRQLKLENAKKRSTEGCYIATAVYGGYDKPEVLILRQYRDNVLKRTLAGKLFIKIYYTLSPPLARKLKGNNWINRKIKGLLDSFVRKLKDKAL